MAGSERWVALIRAIGGATHARMSMSELRDAALSAGLGHPRTVLATGNLILDTALPEAELAGTLTKIIADFGLNNRVFLRRAEALREVMSRNPMPGAALARPNRLLVQFLDTAPAHPQIAALHQHGGPEIVKVDGSDVYIDYLDGVGTSKLTPARLERLLGQPGTARNWNTIGKLVAACG